MQASEQMQTDCDEEKIVDGYNCSICGKWFHNSVADDGEPSVSCEGDGLCPLEPNLVDAKSFFACQDAEREGVLLEIARTKSDR